MDIDDANVDAMRDDLLEAIKFFHQKNWCPATSCNFSFRNPDQISYTISSTGIDKGHFTAANLMIINAAGEPLPDYGHLKPSAETLLHTMLYEDEGVNSIMHTHSVSSTVISRRMSDKGGVWLRGYEVLKGLKGITTHKEEVFIPIFANSQDIRTLSKEIQEYMKTNPTIYGFLLESHGLYSWGSSTLEAKRHIEVLEFLFECELAIIH